MLSLCRYYNALQAVNPVVPYSALQAVNPVVPYCHTAVIIVVLKTVGSYSQFSTVNNRERSTGWDNPLIEVNSVVEIQSFVCCKFY